MTPGGRGSSVDVFLNEECFWTSRSRLSNRLVLAVVVGKKKKKKKKKKSIASHIAPRLFFSPSCGMMSPIHAASMRSTSSVGKTSWNGIVEAMESWEKKGEGDEKKKKSGSETIPQTTMNSDADAALALALQLEEEEAARQEQRQQQAAGARDHVDEVAQNLGYGLSLAAKVREDGRKEGEEERRSD